MADTLPAPRIQFRWTADDRKKRDPMFNWLCYYELVLPLGEHDIRREGKRGKSGELILEMGVTMVGGDHPTSHDHANIPFRDGAHASWDQKALGITLPIYVISPDGTAALLPPLNQP